MSILRIQKEPGCDNPEDVTITLAEATLFTLNSRYPATANIYLDGTLLTTLNGSNTSYTTAALGDYTISLSTACERASVSTSTVLLGSGEGGGGGPFEPVLTPTDVEIDCGQNIDSFPAHLRVALTGAERPINVRMLEDCTPAVEPTLTPTDVEIDCGQNSESFPAHLRVALTGAERPINVRVLEDCTPPITPPLVITTPHGLDLVDDVVTPFPVPQVKSFTVSREGTGDVIITLPGGVITMDNMGSRTWHATPDGRLDVTGVSITTSVDSNADLIWEI